MNNKEQNTYGADETGLETKEVPQELSKKKRILNFWGRVLFFAVLFALLIAVVLGTDAIIEWVKSIFFL